MGRFFLVGLILLGLGADSVPARTKTPVPPLAPGVAHNYADHVISYVIRPVAEQYVRPLPPSVLARAALTGLYQAARIPPVAIRLPRWPDDPSEAQLMEALEHARAALGDLAALRGDEDLLASVRGLEPVLDPYSGLVSGAELQGNRTSARRRGIGLDVAEPLGSAAALVKSVDAGGPAQREGIRPGDRITAINGEPVERIASVPGALHPAEPPSLLDQNQWRPARLKLTVESAGGRRRDVSLEESEFEVESVLGVARHDDNTWDYRADRELKLAHIRLAGLPEGAAGKLAQVLTELDAGGMRGLVLDLRWCPGGLLSESVEVSKLFLIGHQPPGAEAVIATTRMRDGNGQAYKCGGAGGGLGQFPIVVLVNGDTSGGAELVAAALEDNHRARVVGQRTRGKASIQIMLHLPVPGTGFKLTSGMFLRPSGKNLHRFPDAGRDDDWGVRPDSRYEVPISPELARRLKDRWGLQSLRPGPSREALPLDDPTADPQLQEALAVLQRLVRAADVRVDRRGAGRK
jgi:carboxyl-terminal processing protease